MAASRIYRQISSVDWDFPESFPGTSRPIHWYPGTFPAELPATLIQAFSTNGDFVFDPFGGIGTTAAESLRLGRKAILADNNPIALLASLSLNCLLILKTVDPALPEFVFDEIEKLAGISRETQGSLLNTQDDIFSGQVNAVLKSTIYPDISKFFTELKKGRGPSWKDLEVWFERGTLRDIQSLTKIFQVNDRCDFLSILGTTMISGCLRAASSQTQSWGHIADNVRPREFVAKPFLGLCLNWIRRLRNNIRATKVTSTTNLREKHLYLLNHDWSGNKPLPKALLGKAQLLVTSPPYANAIDYTLAQRLSLSFLGYRADAMVEQVKTEIGARRKRFSSFAPENWSDSLVGALEQQMKLLRDSSKICLILPHKEAGREIAATEIEKYLADKGWGVAFRTDRSIRQSRTRQSWTSIKKESILVFEQYAAKGE